MPYDDSQARDKSGMWTSGGSSGGGLPPSAYAAGMAKAPASYTKLNARQAKKVNIDTATKLLAERGMKFDFASSMFDHATLSTSYEVTDRTGKKARMTAKALGSLLTTDRDRL